MSRIGQTTSKAERVEIGERWEAGQNDTQIAQAMQRPIATIRKWRRRYQQQGRAGLVSQMGRPASGVLGNFPKEVSTALLQMRSAHPGWGPVTLLLELAQDERLRGKSLPSRSRIAAYLKQKHLAKPYERHGEMPEAPVPTVVRPHQEWQVDAQGRLPVSGVVSASIVNIQDVFSRVRIDSLPCLRTTHVGTRDYQLVLRRAFVQYGLPEQISLDHDSVCYDNQTASPFPTIFHLWLIGLGIAVRFIHQPPPLEHALIERTHQIVTQQAILGQTFHSQADLQNMLSNRLHFLNQVYPSRTLHGQAPLQAFPHAQHTHRPYRLEWEKECLDLQRIYALLAQGRWFRQTTAAGSFSLGAQRYNARTKYQEQTLEITFDPDTRELVCLPEKGTQVFRLPAKGITKEVLMGDLDPLISLPAYQLALPFSRQDWRVLMLGQELTGTTL